MSKHGTISPEQERAAVAFVTASPGTTAKEWAKDIDVVANVAANRLLALIKKGVLFRVKTRTSFLYYATADLANQGRLDLAKAFERGMHVRPIGEVAGFGTSALKKRVRTKAAFEFTKVDTSKAKVQHVTTPRGRYEPEPGFKGEFTREWEERRKA
jgi:hypothetical protein